MSALKAASIDPGGLTQVFLLLPGKSAGDPVDDDGQENDARAGGESVPHFDAVNGLQDFQSEPARPVPLLRIRVPRGVSARRQSDNVRFSTLSKIRS